MIHTSSVSGNNVEITEEEGERNGVCSIEGHMICKESAWM
jgi:hypothetical protein